VLVRLVRIQGADMNLFDFDWDLTWSAFMLNAEGKIYGRFGGRDPKGPDTRNSLAGLRFALQAALAEHKKDPTAQPTTPPRPPLYIDNVPTAKQFRQGCIHCHQAKELLIQHEKNTGVFKRESLWTFPLPENIGITLNQDQGNLVDAVRANSPAAKVGIQTGDVLERLNGYAVHSFADASYALHKAPLQGEVSVAWLRRGNVHTGMLTLPAEWKRTNPTWRPSILDMLPSLTAYGEDLSPAEKKSLGLAETRLAFRQDKDVHYRAQKMGIQAGDIILGIDNKVLDMKVDEFLGYVRQNYLIDDRATLNLIRAGKRVDLPITLK
jgi:S1-C subfamily serine protease